MTISASSPAASTGAVNQRQLPRWSEIRPLVQVRRPTIDAVDRRLQGALSIDELRSIAKRKTPRAVFDYVDGAADSEETMRRNRAAFQSIELLPEYLSPVADPDLTTTVFGREIGMPLVLAPTGYTRMMHHHGETAVARVAARHHLPYTLSTVGTSTIEQVAAAAPDGNNWFQLYLTKDEHLNRSLLDRAEAAGCSTVMLTVDTPVAARHLKDIRNGLTIPPSLTAKTLADMARHPGWTLNKLTTPPIAFASLAGMTEAIDAVHVADVAFEPTLSYQHLDWLREQWSGRLLVKGIVSAKNAAQAVDHGVDGVIVSNHGGRQLDRSPATLSVLPEIRAAVGSDTTVLLDSGIRHGADILAARALGADAVMVGRAYLYGLMAGGERGVERAVEILHEEYSRSLQLLGLSSSDAIDRHHVRTTEPRGVVGFEVILGAYEPLPWMAATGSVSLLS